MPKEADLHGPEGGRVPQVLYRDVPLVYEHDVNGERFRLPSKEVPLVANRDPDGTVDYNFPLAGFHARLEPDDGEVLYIIDDFAPETRNGFIPWGYTTVSYDGGSGRLISVSSTVYLFGGNNKHIVYPKVELNRREHSISVYRKFDDDEEEIMYESRFPAKNKTAFRKTADRTEISFEQVTDDGLVYFRVNMKNCAVKSKIPLALWGGITDDLDSDSLVWAEKIEFLEDNTSIRLNYP